MQASNVYLALKLSWFFSNTKHCKTYRFLSYVCHLDLMGVAMNHYIFSPFKINQTGGNSRIDIRFYTCRMWAQVDTMHSWDPLVLTLLKNVWGRARVEQTQTGANISVYSPQFETPGLKLGSTPMRRVDVPIANHIHWNPYSMSRLLSLVELCKSPHRFACLRFGWTRSWYTNLLI